MREVAALARVSAKTVSRVFNDDPRVRPETRERVRSALRQLDYVPNTLATDFRSGRAPVIGVAVPDIVDPLFGPIAKAVDHVAAQHDMSVMVTNLGDDPTREREIVEALLRRQVSGLVIAPISTDQAYLTSWAHRTPTVFVDRAPNGVTADTFLADDYEAARAATDHLVEHGHLRIAFVGDDATSPTMRNRLRGYSDALDRAGITPDNGLVVLQREHRDDLARSVAALYTLPSPPTAIFSANARCTMTLVPALAGTDLAVLGFGDFPLAGSLAPALTVMDQNAEALGRLAAQRIVDRLAHPSRRFRRRTLLPATLIERGSCRRTRPDN